MENPNEPVVVNTPAQSNGAGGKIAIIIILLVLVLAAWYFFKGRNNIETKNQNDSAQTADDTSNLNKELDATATVDVEADLKQMDKEFIQ